MLCIRHSRPVDTRSSWWTLCSSTAPIIGILSNYGIYHDGITDRRNPILSNSICPEQHSRQPSIHPSIIPPLFAIETKKQFWAPLFTTSKKQRNAFNRLKRPRLLHKDQHHPSTRPDYQPLLTLASIQRSHKIKWTFNATHSTLRLHTETQLSPTLTVQQPFVDANLPPKLSSTETTSCRYPSLMEIALNWLRNNLLQMPI